MSTEVRVPTLGESVTEATVATWFKKAGDRVAVDEMLCELETDKVTVEAPSPVAGVLKEIVAAEGETVEPDALLAIVEEGAEGAATAEAPKEEAKDAPEKGGSYGSPTAAEKRDAAHVDPKERAMGREGGGSGRSDVEDAPSAKKAMAEAGLSRDQVEGSGRDGRVMKEDVAKAVSAGASAVDPAPQPQTEQGPREERVKMTRLRQTIARRLKEAQDNAAMLTTFNEVDMGAIMELRTEYKDLFLKKHGTKLGFMSFFVKACTHALNEIPEVNAEIDGTEVVYKKYCNIGVAVGTPNGLVVPVLRDAQDMGFAQIEKTIAGYGKKARDGKLTIAEMQGGTFTISNGGVYGSLMSTPILNPPQSGILGMHKIQERPMVVNGQIEVRPMMYLALSYDHRIVDGQGAVTFLVRVKEALEDPRRLLMDL